MTIMRRHVTREIIVPSAITFSVITFLVLVGQVLQQLAKRFSGKLPDIGNTTLMIIYLMPRLMPYTISAALLFGTLIGFAQLSQDGEIIALKAAGIPIRKVFAPIIVLGLVATMFVLLLKGEVSLWTDQKLKELLIKMVLKSPTLVLSEQTWTHESDDMRIFVGNVDDKKMVLRDVNIIMDGKDSPQKTIVAQGGRIYIEDKGVFLELTDGSIHEYDLKNPEQYSTTTFKSLTIPVTIKALNRYVKRQAKPGDVDEWDTPSRELLANLSDPSLSDDKRLALLGPLSERAAVAFMSLTFVLIGAPLGIIPHKSRRFYGVAICAGLLLMYYSLLIMGEALAKRELISPLISGWIPNGFIGGVGVFLMLRAEKR